MKNTYLDGHAGGTGLEGHSGIRATAFLAALCMALAVVVAAFGSSGASARSCNDCDEEPPPQDGGGGGGPAGGSGETPRITITGTFKYSDLDPWMATPTSSTTTTIRPIVWAEVEIRADGRTIKNTRTRLDGSISETVPFTSGSRYAVAILAENSFAKVWDPTPTTVPHVFEVTTASQTATAAGTSLDYTFTVEDPAAPYFNVAEAIRTGALYAEKMRVDPHEQPADRDPKADDQLGVVGVAAWEGGPTFYYPVPDMIELNRDQFTDDAVILHEYAHFLQDQIGSLPWIPTSHNGCEVHDIFGQIVNSPEHAWLEGFADYFAEAVRADSEPGTVGGRRWAALLESPVCRYLSSSIASQDVELYVAGVLWDLIDPARPSEPHDTLAGFAPTIFQIFDRELDVDPGAGPWPSLSSFRAAWDARGLPALNEIMNFLQISGSLPARPLPPPTPDDKVCSKPAPPPDCEPPK